MLPVQLSPVRQLLTSLQEAFTPLADLEETDEAFTVEIELPGVKRRTCPWSSPAPI